MAGENQGNVVSLGGAAGLTPVTTTHGLGGPGAAPPPPPPPPHVVPISSGDVRESEWQALRLRAILREHAALRVKSEQASHAHRAADVLEALRVEAAIQGALRMHAEAAQRAAEQAATEAAVSALPPSPPPPPEPEQVAGDVGEPGQPRVMSTAEKLLLPAALILAAAVDKKNRGKRAPIRSLPRGQQVEEMAGLGWLRVSPSVAKKLFDSGSEIAIFGARDPARRAPKTVQKDRISWEMAIQLAEARRVNLPNPRDRKLVFYVRAR
jgi:hypothetical protein